MMKFVANIISTFYCIHLLGRLCFLTAVLAVGSNAKSVYILKSILFCFFYIKTTDSKLKAMCPKVKVALFCFDPNMLQNGLMSAFNPSVPEAS